LSLKEEKELLNNNLYLNNNNSKLNNTECFVKLEMVEFLAKKISKSIYT